MLGIAQRAVDRGWLRAPSALTGPYNPYHPAYTRDPYGPLDRLRAQAPVCYSRVTGSWVVSSHALATETLSDRRYSSDRTRDTSLRARTFARLARLARIDTGALDNTLTNVAIDVHHRMRQAISYDFGRKRITALRPRMEFWVDKLLDDAAERGGMEVIDDFAGPLPILVVAEILGFPPDDASQLRSWSDSYLVLVDPLIRGAGIGRMDTAFRSFEPYIADTVARKRRSPGDDLITRLLERHEAGEFDEVQLRILIMMLVIAGHEVITNLVGNAMVALLRFPDQRARLIEDPALMPTAIEEFIRYESPIQSVWRIATEDLTVDGVRIPRNRAITVLLGAANNDPEQFHDPRRLDLGRTDNQHLGFALGSHFCAGPWLARTEGAIALSRLLARFPTFRGDPDHLRWKPAAGLRGLYELPVAL